MRLKFIFITIFIFLISISYIVTDSYKNNAISDELSSTIDKLETNYNLILHDYKVASKAILFSILEFSQVKDIISKLADADKNEKDILRKKLYDILKKDFETYKKMGVKLILFTQPNNKVFLRLHKPNIYSDDISSIRFALAAVNTTHKEMSGFEQGKISHAFRFIYPVFDKDKNYLASVDISFSSERLQQSLDEVHKLHSHFLVSKDVIDSRIWSVKSVTTPYEIAIEHENYMMTRRKDATHMDLDISKRVLSENIDYINSEIDKSNKFAIYGQYKNDFLVISFLPISSITSNSNAEAYLVSYTSNTKITKIINEFIAINIINTIIILLILLLIYFMLIKRKEIQKEHQRYLKLMNFASDGIFILDLDGKIVEFSGAAAKMLGYSNEEMINLSIYDWDTQFSKKEILDFIKSISYEPISFETRHKRKDMTIYDASITAVKIDIDSKEYIYASVRDITEKKQREEEVREKLQKFIDTQNSIVILSDGLRLKFANKSFYEFFGYKNLEIFLKDYGSISYKFIEEEGFFNLSKVKETESNWIESLLNLSGRARVVSMSNTELIPHAFAVSINRYDNNDYIVSFSDISDTIVDKDQLKHQATVDELTGAFNRIYFNQNIKLIINRHNNDNLNTGIIFFDIDNFKLVNDTYGHNAGDEILKHIVRLVQQYTINNDKIIRWGGEEFIIVTEAGCIDDVYKNAEHLRSVIQSSDFKDVKKITCSFGCALYDDGKNITDTIKKADEALYKAKNRGRNKVVIANTY